MLSLIFIRFTIKSIYENTKKNLILTVMEVVVLASTLLSTPTWNWPKKKTASMCSDFSNDYANHVKG